MAKYESTGHSVAVNGRKMSHDENAELLNHQDIQIQVLEQRKEDLEEELEVARNRFEWAENERLRLFSKLEAAERKQKTQAFRVKQFKSRTGLIGLAAMVFAVFIIWLSVQTGFWSGLKNWLVDTFSRGANTLGDIFAAIVVLIIVAGGVAILWFVLKYLLPPVARVLGSAWKNATSSKPREDT